jgi:hypothetical protein
MFFVCDSIESFKIKTAESHPTDDRPFRRLYNVDLGTLTLNEHIGRNIIYYNAVQKRDSLKKLL